MPRIEATVSCDVVRSFRVDSVAGLFDIPIEQRASHTFSVDVPGADEPWTLSVIVGPSSSGKTSVARHVYGDALYDPGAVKWPAKLAVIEGFPAEAETRTITETLTAVGFSSPPDWVKPYHALSNGQKFRADLARALLSGKPLVAFDEFTSVVDRRVAITGATAVEKAVRRGLVKKFVAVTCHYDVIPYLQPDWVLDMATQELARGSLPRPSFRIEIIRCKSEAWKLFSPHHYLNASIHPSCQCFLALMDGEPVAFCAVLHTMGYPGYCRISRIVTLPDYQGIGVGSRLMEFAASYMLSDMGYKSVRIQGSHPAIVWHCDRSPNWKLIDVKMGGNKRQTNVTLGKVKGHKPSMVTSAGRAIVSFEFVPEKKHETV
jgi:GNAT superfamily N-acetyltransferase